MIHVKIDLVTASIILFLVGLLGFDKSGSPVWMFPLGKADIHGWYFLSEYIQSMLIILLHSRNY